MPPHLTSWWDVMVATPHCGVIPMWIVTVLLHVQIASYTKFFATALLAEAQQEINICKHQSIQFCSLNRLCSDADCILHQLLC